MAKSFILGNTLALFASTCFAQSDVHVPEPHSAYLHDGRGTIARSGFGLCWRNSYWTSTDAVPGCDGELIPPVSKAIAPAIETGRLIATPPIQTIPVPAPPTPCDFSASLQNDQTFAFNNAVLSSAAKLALKHLITEKFAACTSIESVRITGYSDRLGSTKYNQQLSEQRAAAVAAYLRSNNITAQIVVYGAGQTQQIVACDDKMRPAQLVQCLAPNRRVVLEVKGSTR